MAQYTQGTISLTNGSPTVTGTNTKFVTNNIQPGHILTVVGSNAWHEVLTVNSETQLTLAAPSTQNRTNVTYAITTSFSPIYNIPYPEQNDIETASLFRRAVMRIEEIMNANGLTP